MKKQIIKLSLLSLLVFGFLGFYNTANADTTIHLKISTPVSTLYDKDITVIPCNSDNNTTTNVVATPYCAILQSGLQNNWSWFSFGALLDSLGGISGSVTKDNQGNDVYNFWDWSLNGPEATVGLAGYTLNPGDVVSLNFIDPGNTVTSSPSGGGPLIISSPVATTPTPTPPTTPSPITTIKPSFDSEKAFEFLTTQQQDDGSFGEDVYTDWAALALASSNYQSQTIKLIKYLGAENTDNFSLTDNERRAMTLMTLGLNPYNTNGENYIEKIVNQFDGKQFGDINEDNDDIFALIVLQNAGYGPDDKIISDDISFILKTQTDSGSWNGSVDMTGAAIEALSAFSQNQDVENSLLKAEKFLKDNQNDDGGWGNVSSTAWALEGILGLNEKPEDWVKNLPAQAGGNTPLDYLAIAQDTDGGTKDANIKNKVWETSYVLSALSGKTWNNTMQKFGKIEIKKNSTKINLPKENTATALNAVAENIPAENPPTPKRNWFMRILGNVFGF